jgi:1-acyl-sn-glycerol-3-phosphate acyltransferase
MGRVESRSGGSHLGRRIVAIPAYLLAASLWLGAAPLWIPIAALVDAVGRRRWLALRSGLMLAVYLVCEVLGLAVSAGLWLFRAIGRIDDERWQDVHFRLEAWWGATLFRAMVAIFGLRIEVEGDADLGRGPYLLLLRHASTADTLLASALISRPHGLRLRYVLKRELLWDPCLNVVGNRIPNVFVDRSADDSEGEVRRIAALARGLGPRDGVLIYPEGTRFTEEKRRRVLEGFHRRGEAKLLEYSRSLSAVLPPRPGGTLGLLEEAPEADVVIGAHSGLEGAASLASIWKGELLHRTIRVRFRRIARQHVPVAHEARVAWLREEWERLDAWIESQHSLEAAGGPEEGR